MGEKFETNRLLISETAESEINTIINLENHPDNCKFVWQGSYEDHKSEINDDHIRLLSIKTKTDDQMIGFCLIALNLN